MATSAYPNVQRNKLPVHSLEGLRVGKRVFTFGQDGNLYVRFFGHISIGGMWVKVVSDETAAIYETAVADEVAAMLRQLTFCGDGAGAELRMAVYQKTEQ